MRPWKEASDPLFRGDSVAPPGSPATQADPSLVRHILQVDGPGQQSPYLSTTESEETATYFAVPKGFVLSTSVSTLKSAEVGYLGKMELLQLLVGKGKGGARWHSAAEVRRAAHLVEQHAEHLADFRPHDGAPAERLGQIVTQCFQLRRPL